MSDPNAAYYEEYYRKAQEGLPQGFDSIPRPETFGAKDLLKFGATLAAYPIAMKFLQMGIGKVGAKLSRGIGAKVISRMGPQSQMATAYLDLVRRGTAKPTLGETIGALPRTHYAKRAVERIRTRTTSATAAYDDWNNHYKLMQQLARAGGNSTIQLKAERARSFLTKMKDPAFMKSAVSRRGVDYMKASVAFYGADRLIGGMTGHREAPPIWNIPGTIADYAKFTVGFFPVDLAMMGGGALVSGYASRGVAAFQRLTQRNSATIIEHLNKASSKAKAFRDSTRTARYAMGGAWREASNKITWDQLANLKFIYETMTPSGMRRTGRLLKTGWQAGTRAARAEQNIYRKQAHESMLSMVFSAIGEAKEIGAPYTAVPRDTRKLILGETIDVIKREKARKSFLDKMLNSFLGVERSSIREQEVLSLAKNAASAGIIGARARSQRTLEGVIARRLRGVKTEELLFNTADQKALDLTGFDIGSGIRRYINRTRASHGIKQIPGSFMSVVSSVFGLDKGQKAFAFGENQGIVVPRSGASKPSGMTGDRLKQFVDYGFYSPGHNRAGLFLNGKVFEFSPTAGAELVSSQRTRLVRGPLASFYSRLYRNFIGMPERKTRSLKEIEEIYPKGKIMTAIRRLGHNLQFGTQGETESVWQHATGMVSKYFSARSVLSLTGERSALFSEEAIARFSKKAADGTLSKSERQLIMDGVRIIRGFSGHAGVDAVDVIQRKPEIFANLLDQTVYLGGSAVEVSTMLKSDEYLFKQIQSIDTTAAVFKKNPKVGEAIAEVQGKAYEYYREALELPAAKGLGGKSITRLEEIKQFVIAHAIEDRMISSAWLNRAASAASDQILGGISRKERNLLGVFDFRRKVLEISDNITPETSSEELVVYLKSLAESRQAMHEIAKDRYMRGRGFFSSGNMAKFHLEDPEPTITRKLEASPFFAIPDSFMNPVEGVGKWRSWFPSTPDPKKPYSADQEMTRAGMIPMWIMDRTLRVGDYVGFNADPENRRSAVRMGATLMRWGAGMAAASIGWNMADTFTDVNPAFDGTMLDEGLNVAVSEQLVKARLLGAKIQDITGITGGLQYFEGLMPGSVGSPFARMARAAGPMMLFPTIGASFAGSRGAAAGAIFGAMAGAIGAVTDERPYEQLVEEYAGRKDVAVRKGRWWELCAISTTQTITYDGIKKIEDVAVGDLVINKHGEFTKVAAISSRKHNGKVYGFRTVLNKLEDHAMFTEDHEQLVYRDGDVAWVQSKEVVPGDFLLLPRISKSNTTHVNVAEYCDKVEVEEGFVYALQSTTAGTLFRNPRSAPVPASVPIDRNLGELFGYYMAEGSIDYKNNQPRMVEFAFHEDEKEYIDRVVEIVSEVFGLDATVRNRKEKCTVVRIVNSTVAKLFYSLFHSGRRKIPSRDMLTWSDGFLAAIVGRYIDGDGSVYNRGRTSEVTWSSCQMEVSLFIRDALTSLGIASGLSHRVSHEDGGSFDCYTGRLEASSVVKAKAILVSSKLLNAVSISEGSTNAIVLDGYVGWKVIDVIEEHYEGTVHDICVPDGESFCTLNYITHNSRGPLQGRKIDYYRPNWFARMKSQYEYTPDYLGSKLEASLFADPPMGFNPVGALVDPYHYERCVAHGTNIVTLEGLKPIEEITEEDMVLSGDGNFHRVLATADMIADSGIELKAAGVHEKIKTTPEHRFFVMSTNNCISKKHQPCRPKEWDRCNGCRLKDSWDIGWKRADAITIGDFVGYPLPKEATQEIENIEFPFTGKTNSIQHETVIEADYDAGRFIGLWLAEGSASNRGIAFDFHINETEYAGFVYRFIKDRLLLNPKEEEKPDVNTRRIRASSASICRAFSIYCGPKKGEKYPDMRWLQFNSEFLVGIVRGLIEGDGSISSDIAQVSFASVSEQLAVFLRLALLRFGIKAGLSAYDKDGFQRRYTITCNGRDTKKVLALISANGETSDGAPRRTFIYNGFLWAKVMSVSSVDEEFNIRDISVEGAHSFCSIGYLLHNTHYLTRPYPTAGGLGQDIPFIGPAVSFATANSPRLGPFHLPFTKPQIHMHSVELARSFGRTGGGGYEESPSFIAPEYAERYTTDNYFANSPGMAAMRSPTPMSPNSIAATIGGLEYKAVIEPMGLVGFGYEALMGKLQGGSKAGLFEPEATMEGSSELSSYRRRYWDLNLGGLLGMTEFIRRFIPRKQYQTTYYNEIPNRMPGWLNTGERGLDFTVGDPFCITPDTAVNTPDGMVPAAEIKDGDILIDHQGNYDKVRRHLRRPIRPNEKVYELKVATMSPYVVKASEEHPIWTKAGWVEIKDINRGDYVGYPLPKLENVLIDGPLDLADHTSYPHTDKYIYICGDQQYIEIYEYLEENGSAFSRGDRKALIQRNGWSSKKLENAQRAIRLGTIKRIPRYVDTTTREWGIIQGYWLSEGSVNGSSLSFAFHIKEQDYINELDNAFFRLFGCRGGQYPASEGNGTNYVISCSPVSEAIPSVLGKGFDKKKMIPYRGSTLDTLRALFNGDGSYFFDNGKPRLSLKLINPELILQVREVLLAFGFVASITEGGVQLVIRGRNAADCAIFLGTKFKEGGLTEGTNTYYHIEDGYVWMRVLSNEETIGDQVIGFEMEGDNSSFCAGGVATHNTKIPEGELRLPGRGYESVHNVRKTFPASPSSFGYSVGEMVERLLNMQPPMDDELYDMTEQGTFIHRVVQEQLARDNVLVTAEQMIYDPYTNMKGYLDAIIKRGNNQKEVMEIKTASGESLMNLTKPKYKHYSQINFYMRATGTRKGTILYVSREDPRNTKAFDVYYSEDRFNKDYANLSQARLIAAALAEEGEGFPGAGYSHVDRLRILADVAPYSDKYKEELKIVRERARAGLLTEEEQEIVKTAVAQRGEKARQVDLYPYRFTGSRFLNPDDSYPSSLNPNQYIRPASEYTLPERAVGALWEGFCFPPYETIDTRRGYVYAKEVRENDEVRTHTGEWKVVEKVWKRKTKPTEEALYSIKAGGHEWPLRVTDGHKIWTERGFVSASDITHKDWILYAPVVPAYDFEFPEEIDIRKVFPGMYRDCELDGEQLIMTHGSSNRVSPIIKVDQRFMRVLGAYFSRGGLVKGAHDNARALKIAFSTDDIKHDVMNTLFDYGFKHHAVNTKDGVYHCFGCPPISNLVYDLMGSGYTKKLPEFVLQAPEIMLKAFALGMYLNLSTNSFLVGTEKIHRLFDMVKLFIRLKVPHRIVRTAREGRWRFQFDENSLRETLGLEPLKNPKRKVSSRMMKFNDDGTVSLKVSRIKKASGKGKVPTVVYDFTVADNHTLSTPLYTVHNSHLDSPFHSRLLNYRSPIEAYQRDRIYGRQSSFWEHPMRDFIKPWVTTAAASDNPVQGAIHGAFLGGIVGGPVGALGGIAAGSVWGGAQGATGGPSWIPKSIEQQRELNAYFDKLEYIKAKRMYDLTGQEEFRQTMGETMTGLNAAGMTRDNWTSMFRAVPYSEKSYIGAFLKTTNPRERDQILDLVPEDVGEMLRIKWARQSGERYAEPMAAFSRMQDVDRFLQENPIPSADWGGWAPAVVMDDVKLKSIKHEGLDTHDFGLGWKDQMKRMNESPFIPDPIQMTKLSNYGGEFATPDMFASRSSLVTAIQQTVSGQGMRASINIEVLPGSFGGARPTGDPPDMVVINVRREEVR